MRAPGMAEGSALRSEALSLGLAIIAPDGSDIGVSTLEGRASYVAAGQKPPTMWRREAVAPFVYDRWRLREVQARRATLARALRRPVGLGEAIREMAR